MEDKKKFELLLEEKRHKELIAALSQLPFEKLSVDLKESVKELMKWGGESNERISSLIKSFNSKNTDKELVTLFDVLGKDMEKRLNDIYLLVKAESERKKEWEFTVNRSHHNGLIESVTAKQIK